MPPPDREMSRLLLICGVIGMLYAFGMVVVNASHPGAETEAGKATVADNWSKVLRLRAGFVDDSR